MTVLISHQLCHFENYTILHSFKKNLPTLSDNVDYSVISLDFSGLHALRTPK